MREFGLGDEGVDMGGQDMNTFIGEFVDIGEELIPEVPEVFLRHYSRTNSIKGNLRHPLMVPSSAASSQCTILQPHQCCC